MSKGLSWKDQQIQDYLDRRDYKQGLAQCEKRLKKEPKNLWLQAQKAQFCARVGRLEECRAVIAQVLGQERSITDVRALLALYEARIWVIRHPSVPSDLSLIGTGGEDIVKGWETLIKTFPDISFTWLVTSVQHGLWIDAQKALNHLKRLHPAERSYKFSWVIITQMVADLQSGIDPAVSRIYTEMAYRTLAKYADSTPSGTIASADSNTMISSRDVRVMVEIFQKQGRHEDLVRRLSSDNVGITSMIGSNDWEFELARIRSLKIQGKWEELWCICYDSLKAASSQQSHTRDISGQTSVEEAPSELKAGTSAWAFRADDWAMWDALIRAAFSLKDKGKQLASLEVMEEFGRSRNARLAKLSFLAHAMKEPGSLVIEPGDILLEACRRYFHDFSSKPSCFSELRPFIEALNAQERQSFLEVARSSSERPEATENRTQVLNRLHRETNLQKIEYLVLVSLGDTSHDGAVQASILSCLSSYAFVLQKAPEGDHSPWELARLAAMTLIKLYLVRLESETSAQVHLVQAFILLFASSVDSDSQSVLVLLATSQRLAAYSYAMALYPRLRIKETVNDTLSHVLYTRISTSHPYKANITEKNKSTASVDPLDWINNILKTYQRQETTIGHTIQQILEEPWYDKLSDMLSIRSTLHRSLMRRLLTIEQRRIARLRGLHPADDEIEDQSLWLRQLEDHRDFTTLMTSDSTNTVPLQVQMLNGRNPGSYWLATTAIWDSTYSILTATKPILTNTNDAESLIQHATAEDKCQLTDAEEEVGQAWMLLRLLVLRVMLGTKPAGFRFDTTLASVESWLNEQLASWKLASTHLYKEHVQLPGHEDIQEMFLYLEVLRAFRKWHEAVTAALKQKTNDLNKEVGKNQLTAISDLVEELFKAVRKRALDWKNGITEDKFAPRLAAAVSDGPIGAAMTGQFGHASISRAVDSLIASVAEALDGVLAVRL